MTDNELRLSCLDKVLTTNPGKGWEIADLLTTVQKIYDWVTRSDVPQEAKPNAEVAQVSDEEARACALQFGAAIRDGSTDAERILADA